MLKCIRMLTFLPLEEIDKMANWEGSQLNEAKEILAYELTKLVHGQEEAEKAKAASKALFAGGGDTEHMPTTELTNDDFGGGSIDVLTLLVKCGLAASKGEARLTGAAGRRHRQRREGDSHRDYLRLRAVHRRRRSHQKGQEGVPQGGSGVSRKSISFMMLAS